MLKYNIGDIVTFTIHGYSYDVQIKAINTECNLFKIYNIDTNNEYWVHKYQLSKHEVKNDKEKIKNER